MHARAEQAADVRDVLVILLAVAAGAVDAISFFGLGGAFAANMTGNVVLLGAAAGGFTHALLRCGAALLGYLAGAYAAARWVRNGPDGLWPAWMTRGLLVVALAECCVLGGWLGVGGRPGLAGQVAMLAVFALAMGTQGALAHRLGLGGVTTTYVTGTLTGFVGELATDSGSGRNRVQRLGMVLALAVGAALAALLVFRARQAAAFLPPALTIAAVVLAQRSFGLRPAAS